MVVWDEYVSYISCDYYQAYRLEGRTFKGILDKITLTPF